MLTSRPVQDLIIVGGGISGASLAFHAARSGARVLVLEKDAEPGGCLCTARTGAGFWYELGAHTCYNSYGAFLELLEGCELIGELQPRAKPVLRFLDDGRVLPGKNLGLLVSQFSKLELFASIPRWFGGSQEGQTVRSYYSRFVGAKNYERVLGPMLSAVPSQTADDFPADMLFKKRDRRKDVLRSFTLKRGLQTAVERALARPGVAVRTNASAKGVERSSRGFVVALESGERLEASKLALALPPQAAARLLAGVAPELAALAARLKEAELDTLGFAVRAERVQVPTATFLIPLKDQFHSIVTRDVVPDATWRGFAVHFRPGLAREARVRRACEVLGVAPTDLEAVRERRVRLPSPVLGHADTVRALDERLAKLPLALTGNWFGGLAIEDCVLRSRAEWQRLANVG